MGNPKRIEMGDSDSGICIEYVASRKVFYIWGWYGHFVGIEGGEISLEEFYKKLGIKVK